MNYQLKLWSMILLLSIGLLASCSNDDNDSDPTLTASELLQTTWNACVCDYDEDGKEVVHEEYLIVEFLTETQGKVSMVKVAVTLLQYGTYTIT